MDAENRIETYVDMRGRNHEVIIPCERPWGRRETLERCQDYLTNGFHVLEFGTARQPTGMMGDGWSTLFWATLATKLRGCVWSIDADPKAIHFSKWLTRHHRQLGRVVHEVFDGYDFIGKLGTTIDPASFFPLLYYTEHGTPILKEYQIDLVYLDGPDDPRFAYDILRGLWKKGLYPHYILIDDVHEGRLQKGEILMPYLNMTKDIEQIFFEDGQALYVYTGDKHKKLAIADRQLIIDY